MPASPEYILRSPDSVDIPFPEVLSRYNGYVAGNGSLDLRPGMELRVENAYYEEGRPKHGLDGFLGTEVARYRVRGNSGIHVLSIHSELKRRPPDQPPVQKLMRPSQMSFAHYRFFFAIVFRKKGETRGSVLLGTARGDELDQLTSRLIADPESICEGSGTHCTVFPEACSVALEIEITVNRVRRTVAWSSVLATIAADPHHMELRRLYLGRLTRVEFDPTDPKALRMPLLPGDQIIWD